MAVDQSWQNGQFADDHLVVVENNNAGGERLAFGVGENFCFSLGGELRQHGIGGPQVDTNSDIAGHADFPRRVDRGWSTCAICARQFCSCERNFILLGMKGTCQTLIIGQENCEVPRHPRAVSALTEVGAGIQALSYWVPACAGMTGDLCGSPAQVELFPDRINSEPGWFGYMGTSLGSFSVVTSTIISR